MSNELEKNPYVAVAACCGGASAGIAFIGMFFMHQISDAGMFAIALMVIAPSAMGVGICYFLNKRQPPPQT